VGELHAVRHRREPITVGELETLARTGLEPYPDNWPASIRPAGTLPWYPMVLHRGGYPDGS